MPTLCVHDGQHWHTWTVTDGTNLRRALLDHGLSPYAALTQRLNCGGRGLCATCGVRIDEAPPPSHWHDRMASVWRYPRLSCQITITTDLTVRFVADKRIWGKRSPRAED